MARKNECIAMLLAGGQGSRLGILTHKIAKPAVPFGGKYRIIDFPLSNCVNSGIYTVGVLTQYQPLELNDYVGNGEPWDLDRTDGGVHILSPYQQIQGTDWYKGTANAIYQNIHFIDKYDPEYVVVLSGDHIYKMDYADMLAFHKQQDAACTIAMREVEWKEASRFGLMIVNEDGTISEFEEKPANPRANTSSPTRTTPSPPTTSVTTSSPPCMKPARRWSLISSTATGETSEPSRASGKPIWTSCPRPRAST